MMAKSTVATQTAEDRQAAEYRQWLERISPKWRNRLQLLPDEPIMSVGALVKILNDRSGKQWKAQEAAAWFISRMELSAEERQQAIDALLRFMISPGYDCLERAKLYAAGVWGFSFTIFTGILTFLTATQKVPWVIGIGVSLLSGVLLGLPSAYLAFIDTKDINHGHFQQARSAVASALGSLKAREGVAYMLYALHRGTVEADNILPSPWNIELRRIAANALPGMLETLAPADYGTIPATVVPHLCRTLGHSEETLVLSALEALEKVGDGQAAAPVERCAHKDSRPRVRESAQRILPILQERQRNEQAPHILLRPSSAVEAPADQLLRAVSEVVQTAPEQLLRPGDAPSEI